MKTRKYLRTVISDIIDSLAITPEEWTHNPANLLHDDTQISFDIDRDLIISNKIWVDDKQIVGVLNEEELHEPNRAFSKNFLHSDAILSTAESSLIATREGRIPDGDPEEEPMSFWERIGSFRERFC